MCTVSVVNIAAYHFAPLQPNEELRCHLRGRCQELELKGTILLTPEGINCFLAGAADAIEEILAELRQMPGFEDLEVKYSESTHQPFTRLLIKLKKEIITFRQQDIDPLNKPAPRLSAKELKNWLDEGKEVVLLDTRNEYEVRLGTFANAIDPQIDEFCDFPKAVEQLPEELKKKPIVTFCTGGVRCEKAAPWMINQGFEEVYQLDGGILKYFEEVGGKHWDGECFVFDRRVALNPDLEETPTQVCWACQEPVTPQEQRDPRFVRGKSCPHCVAETESAEMETAN